MGSYYSFFRKLPDLLKAADYRAPFLGSQDHFLVSYTYPFILWEPIECEERTINASRGQPIFCVEISYLINPHLKKEEKYLKRTQEKVDKIFQDFTSQPFFQNAFLCPQNGTIAEWITKDDGSEWLKDAKYFTTISLMVKYCTQHSIIDLNNMDEKERELVKLWLEKDDDET